MFLYHLSGLICNDRYLFHTDFTYLKISTTVFIIGIVIILNISGFNIFEHQMAPRPLMPPPVPGNGMSMSMAGMPPPPWSTTPPTMAWPPAPPGIMPPPLPPGASSPPHMMPPWNAQPPPPGASSGPPPPPPPGAGKFGVAN